MGQVVRWLRQTTPEITKTTNTARGRYKFQWTRKSDLTLPNLRRRPVKISYGSTTQVDMTGLSSCLTEQLTNRHPLLHPGMCCEWDLSVMGPQLGKDSVLTTSKSVNITYIQFANLRARGLPKKNKHAIDSAISLFVKWRHFLCHFSSPFITKVC